MMRGQVKEESGMLNLGRRAIIAALFVALCGGFGLADVAVREKSKVDIKGGVGRAARMFGGKAAREGVVREQVLVGERLLSKDGRTGTLIDLAGEQIHTINYKRRRIETMSFAEMKAQMAEAQAALAGSPFGGGGQAAPAGANEWETTLEVADGDARATIAGHACRELIVTLTTTRKGQSLDQGGGSVLRVTMMIGPKIAGLDEITSFHKRYLEKTGLLENVQLGNLLGSHPGLRAAMDKLEEQRGRFEGSALRTEMVYETVAVPGGAPEAEAGEESGGMLRGLRARLGKRRGQKDAEAGSQGGRREVFSSMSEVLEIRENPAASEVALPSGFKKR